MRILIVDDEQPFLKGLQQYLEESGIDVDTAETFEESIIKLNQNHYDFAILDIRLTGVLGEEGLEILQFIKSHETNTKAIILTGFGNPEIMQRAILLGADYYYEKPVPPSTLEDILKGCELRG